MMNVEDKVDPTSQVGLMFRPVSAAPTNRTIDTSIGSADESDSSGYDTDDSDAYDWTLVSHEEAIDYVVEKGASYYEKKLVREGTTRVTAKISNEYNLHEGTFISAFESFHEHFSKHVFILPGKIHANAKAYFEQAVAQISKYIHETPQQAFIESLKEILISIYPLPKPAITEKAQEIEPNESFIYQTPSKKRGAEAFYTAVDTITPEVSKIKLKHSLFNKRYKTSGSGLDEVNKMVERIFPEPSFDECK